MPKISIIVAMYNSSWEKLKITINSILIQTGIDYEIIFADDGSDIKLNNQIIRFIPENINYRFSDSNTNIGTVSNITNALKYVNGDYVKVISPGDFFNGKHVLKEWVAYMLDSNADLSFCDAIYYRNVNSKPEIIISKASPKNSYIYHKNRNRTNIFVDYLLANDLILGASVMVKKSIIIRYLEEINGKIKYAEDYMIRLMVFDNMKICHVNSAFIWYEYGDGVSTAKCDKWAKLLHKDFESADNLIKSRKGAYEKLQKRYISLLTDDKFKFFPHKLKKVLSFPTMLLYRIQMRFFYHRTTKGNIEIFEQIYKYDPQTCNLEK